ncbi:MAG: PhoX family phosphatase [Phycisphaerales bacterium]
MHTLDRRTFLHAAGLASIGFLSLRRASLASGMRVPKGPLGPLRPDPRGILDLPDGFTYSIISRIGDRMSDGLLVPGRPDGMAAFPGPDGLTIVVRNHENETISSRKHASPFGAYYALLSKIDTSKLYDRGHGRTPSHGGTTTFVWDTREHKLVRQFLSLGGTVRNCAGGPTPWGSWLTCEESVQLPDDQHEQSHGWVFEVPATHEPVLHSAVPIRQMGRFNHEAVAVDPQTGIVYLTEDRSDGCVYRYIPSTPGRLADGGRLQALALIDRPRFDTRNHDQQAIACDEPLRVRWIDVEEAESPRDDLRYRSQEAGAAIFSRGEGIAWGKDGVFIVCTDGGKARRGQVWRYRPSSDEGKPTEAQSPGLLTLFIEPNDQSIIDMPDNCTIAPWGDLVLCEDGSEPDSFVRGLTASGEVYNIARNAIDASEFAGCTFSPDGSTLFVNIMDHGLTVAIRGPWPV